MATTILVPGNSMALPYSCGCCGSTAVCALLTQSPYPSDGYPYQVIRYRGQLAFTNPGAYYYATFCSSGLYLNPIGGGAYFVQFFGEAANYEGTLPAIPGSCDLTRVSGFADSGVSTLHLVVDYVHSLSNCCDLSTVDSCSLVGADLPTEVTIESDDTSILWDDPILLPQTSLFDSGGSCFTALYSERTLVTTCTVTDPFGTVGPPATYNVYRKTVVTIAGSTGSCLSRAFGYLPAGSVGVSFNIEVENTGGNAAQLQLYTAVSTLGFHQYAAGGTVKGPCDMNGISIPVTQAYSGYNFFTDVICCPTRILVPSCSGFFSVTGVITNATVSY